MGKTALMLLIMLAISAIAISGQGQTDTSTGSATTTTTTTDKEIHDYDIIVNSLDNGRYTIGLKNNLLLSEIDVFFDGKPVGSIPKGPAWKEFEVEALPTNVRVSGEGKDWYKDLRDYVPLAFEKGYGIIEENLIGTYKDSEDHYELGLKVKIEYPLRFKLGESEEIVVELITEDAKVATTPDLGHNIGSGEIKIACDESIFKEEGLGLWIDPVRITDDGLFKPYNEYYNYEDLFNINKRDSMVIETEAKIISVLPFVDWYVASQDVLDFRPDAMEKEDIFLCGDVPQSSLFYDDNKNTIRSYNWNLDFFKTFTDSANRVKLRFPFHLESSESSSFAIYVIGEYNQNSGQERGIFAYEKALSPESIKETMKETVVQFPDPNLEAAIRAAVNKPEGAINISDLDGLNNFDASNKDIKDITGLESCINLRTLDLRGNQISDVSPLSRLTNLEWLFIDSSKITDVSPLSGLINLKDLVLSGNSDIGGQILDISPLSHLTNLVSLELRYNQIADVSPLSGLTNLTILRLGNNQIIDVSTLSGLTNLEWLDLSENKIVDVSPLSRLINLKNLELRYNQIADVSLLSGLINMKTLDLRGNLITDVSTLSGLTNLEWLDLSENKIVDVSPLSRLINLDLDLFDNNITDVSSSSGTDESEDSISALLADGYSYFIDGRYEKALVSYDRATELDPFSDEAWVGRGKALCALGKRDEGFQSIDKAINLNASNGQNWIEKANLYSVYNEYDEAIECMDKAINLDRSNKWYWYVKGRIFFDEGNYDKTIECCNEAIKLDPSYSKAWVKKAIALKRLGRYEEALECAEKGTQLDPDWGDNWHVKGTILRALGKYSQADIAFKQEEKSPGRRIGATDKGVEDWY